jgi:hypothetical protein
VLPNIFQVVRLVFATWANLFATRLHDMLGRIVTFHEVRFHGRLLVALCGPWIHFGLLQIHMNAFRVEMLTARQLKKRFEDITAEFCSARPARHSEMIATTGNFHVQSILDLSNVLIKLAAEIGKTLIVGGFENDVP